MANKDEIIAVIDQEKEKLKQNYEQKKQEEQYRQALLKKVERLFPS